MGGIDVDFSIGIRNPLEYLVSADPLPDLSPIDREAFIQFAYKKLREYLDPETGGNPEIYKRVVKAYEVYNESPESRKKFIDEYIKHLSPQQVYDQKKRRVDLEWRRAHAAAKGFAALVPDVVVPEFSGKVTLKTAANSIITLANSAFAWEQEYAAEGSDAEEQQQVAPLIRRLKLSKNAHGETQVGILHGNAVEAVEVDPHKLPLITVFISKDEDERGRTLRAQFEKHKILNFPALIGPDVSSQATVDSRRYNTERIAPDKMAELISLSTFGIDLLPRKAGDRVYLFSWNSFPDSKGDGCYTLEGEVLHVEPITVERKEKEQAKKPGKGKSTEVEAKEKVSKQTKRAPSSKEDKPNRKPKREASNESKSREPRPHKRKS